MTPAKYDNILSLIAATILADKQIYPSEIDTFVKATRKLQFAQAATPKLSEARLLNWYEMHQEGILKNLSTPYFKDWFYSLLETLKNFPEKEAVLNVMREISLADGEVHISERALVSLTEHYWKLN